MQVHQALSKFPQNRIGRVPKFEILNVMITVQPVHGVYIRIVQYHCVSSEILSLTPTSAPCYLSLIHI